MQTPMLVAPRQVGLSVVCEYHCSYSAAAGLCLGTVKRDRRKRWAHQPAATHLGRKSTCSCDICQPCVRRQGQGEGI